MPTKAGGVQISLSTLLQLVAAVVISYMLNQVLGMEAKVKGLEVKVQAMEKTSDVQASSIKSLWEKKQAKKEGN